MKPLLLALTFCFSGAAFAIDCPQYTLTCSLQKLNANLGYVIAKTKTVNFVAFNDSEPSEAPNSCAAWSTFSTEDTGLGVEFNASVGMDLVANLFVEKDHGALSPQVLVEATPGKVLTLIYQQQKMVCVLQ